MLVSKTSIEVLEEFASHGQTQPQTDNTTTVGVEWIKLPPWRERFPSGKLGPEYGPRLSQYEQQMAEHREKYQAGGLWDPEEDYPRECVSLVTGEVQVSSPPLKDERIDAERVSRFVRRNSTQIPAQELEVYFHYWRDLLSVSAVARRMGLKPNTIKTYILRLRMRSQGVSPG